MQVSTACVVDYNIAKVGFFTILTQERALAEKKVIAVIGATGAQGGCLARAIMSDKSGGFTPALSPEGRAQAG